MLIIRERERERERENNHTPAYRAYIYVADGHFCFYQNTFKQFAHLIRKIRFKTIILVLPDKGVPP